MAKVLVNLTTGMEDAERVTVALLVATSALEQGKEVVIFATQEAVRLGLPGVAVGEGCEGCPPIERLFSQFAEGGGELWLCPFCVNSRELGEEEFVAELEDRGGDADVAVGRRRRDGDRLLTLRWQASQADRRGEGDGRAMQAMSLFVQLTGGRWDPGKLGAVGAQLGSY